MKKRLFLYTTLILFLGLLSYFAVSIYVTYANNLNIAKYLVTETAKFYAHLYTTGTELSHLVKAENDTRVTFIAPDGAVLADSRPIDVNAVENHLTRPEIEAAASGAPAVYVRYSDTLGADLIYYALKVNSGDSYVFIRVAVPVAKIETYLFQSLPVLILLLLLVALLCFFFARSMICRIIRPFEYIGSKLRSLAGGEYVPGSIPGSFEEIDRITYDIDEVAGILQNSFNALSIEKAKLDYILNNIGDGLFVVDETKSIILINASALGIFNASPGVTEKNLNYLSYNKTIAAAVNDCVNSEKNAVFEIALHGHIYFVTIKRLPETLLTMVVLSDVTENRENAKRREEFFANASHELKTPLTAIKGFNELTAINSTDENIRKYIDGITRETDRMLSLIGNMLKLSELESAQEINPVAVSLAKIVNEVRDTLSAAISEKSMSFEVAGDAEAAAEQRHIYDLIKNLVENAVRYTGETGSVAVKIESDKKAARLVVSDNGIGISPEEQTRIFERFYRVEKSRSQRNGGTGLGLSIVKHICVLYGWKLTLKSRLGAGTEVTVEFGGGQRSHEIEIHKKTRLIELP